MEQLQHSSSATNWLVSLIVTVVRMLESNPQYRTAPRPNTCKQRNKHRRPIRYSENGKEKATVPAAQSDFAAQPGQQTAYAIQTVSEREQLHTIHILQAFAWDAAIDGYYEQRTSQLVIRFDGGEALSAAAESALVARLGKAVQPVRMKDELANPWRTLQTCPEQE